MGEPARRACVIGEVGDHCWTRADQPMIWAMWSNPLLDQLNLTHSASPRDLHHHDDDDSIKEYTHEDDQDSA